MQVVGKILGMVLIAIALGLSLFVTGMVWVGLLILGAFGIGLFFFG